MIISFLNQGGGTGSGVTPAEVDSLIQSAITQGEYINNAEYISSAKTIILYQDETEVATIDATAFIKDGMVDSVTVSGSILTIVFNTDAGKEPINVDLSDVVDLSNYYTKTDVDAIASGKVDTSALSAYTLESNFVAHSGNTNIHTTAQEKALWNSVSGKADSSAVTQSLSSKQDTLVSGQNIKTINSQSLLGSGNIDIQGGGGATYSAGTNISIDTANTINCTIPAYFNSNEQKGDIAIGTRINNTNGDYYKVVIGRQIDTYGNSNSSYSVGIAPASNNSSFYSQLKGSNSVGIGKYFQITAGQSVAVGSETESSIAGGVAIGYKAKASGTTKMNLNNQITVDTNNQVYISNSANTSTYCVQEKIETTEAALGGLKFVSLTQSEYDQLATKDSATIYFIKDNSN